ncbi:MAG TPA: Hsp20/alpha crystallin family protein [Vicinamibacterales bacterium]|nr:Hsp20/alpha crystallin family protein [Vicinamibacterales bacterium]
MSLMRFDPFREMAALQERVNRIFADAIARRDEDVMSARGSWVPPVDIYQADDHTLVLTMELPDLKREDITLNVENHTLTIAGQKRPDESIEEHQYRRIERTYGSFSRSFSLPGTADTNNISAEYKNGVLTVRIPQREEAKPKQIEVKVH